MKKSLLGVAFLFLVLAAPGIAKADTVIFSDWGKFEGTPSFTPILTATITDYGTDTVLITMEATSLPGSEKITEWYFNADVAGPILFAHDSGLMADSVEADPNGLKADGDGKFDILFKFSTSGLDLFNVDGAQSVWKLSFSGLTAIDFMSKSESTGGPGPFYSAIKLGNAFWAPGTVTVSGPDIAPEPATLTLLGIGLLGGGVARFRKRLK